MEQDLLKKPKLSSHLDKNLTESFKCACSNCFSGTRPKDIIQIVGVGGLTTQKVLNHSIAFNGKTREATSVSQSKGMVEETTTLPFIYRMKNPKSLLKC